MGEDALEEVVIGEEGEEVGALFVVLFDEGFGFGGGVVGEEDGEAHVAVVGEVGEGVGEGLEFFLEGFVRAGGSEVGFF